MWDSQCTKRTIVQKQKKEAEEAVSSIPLYKGNPVVFFDMEVDNRPVGRIVMQLRKDVVPKTAENFRALCTGEKGFGFRSSRLHAIMPGSYLHGGDIIYGTGEGGTSIYGADFEDENFTLRHEGPGVVSMASGSPNENNSQFFISLSKAPLHDGRYVVVGNVMDGMDVIYDLEKYGTWRGMPTREVRVARSGQLKLPAHVELPEAPAPGTAAEADTASASTE
jgi:cyclophilin family peptidyl-prolyl cis-trans isomerase